MEMDDPSAVSRLGVIGIIREALLLPCRNKKLMLSVFLLAFLPCSLLQIGDFVYIQPLLDKFIFKLHLLSQMPPTIPQYKELFNSIESDIQSFLKTNPIRAVPSFLFSSLSMMYVFYASALAYSGDLLDIYPRMRRSFGALLATRIHVELLSHGYTFASCSAAMALIIEPNRGVASIVLGCAALLAACLFFIYLSMVWKLGLAMSALEEGCYGFEALGAAGKVVEGRRVQGFLISFVFVSLRLLTVRSYGHAAPSFLVRNFSLMLEMFFEMIVTVFYLECRRKHPVLEVKASG